MTKQTTQSAVNRLTAATGQALNLEPPTLAADLWSENPYLKVLLYGDSGTGKTLWGAMAPKPLILLLEGQGLSTIGIAGNAADTKLLSRYRGSPSQPGFAEWFSAVKSGKATKDGYLVPVPGKRTVTLCQTIVIDSLTEVHDLMLECYTNSKGPNWGAIQRDMRALVKDIRTLPVNVICITLSIGKMYQDEDDPDKQYRRVEPELFGKMSAKVNRNFSCVGYMHKRGGSRAIAWDLASTSYITKPAPGSIGKIDNIMMVDAFAEDGSRQPCHTLGSMMLALYPELDVAHTDMDNRYET
jgi:hypothetical protein